MYKHIHLVCPFLKNRNYIICSKLNKEFWASNVNKENETTTIISPLNNLKILNQSTFQIEKHKFKLNLKNMFEGISNLDERMF